MKLSQITNSLVGSKDDTLIKAINTQESFDDKDQSSFAGILKQSLEEVNQSQEDAYTAMGDIATGKVDNLQEAVETIQEAEMDLKLALEVKNKALGAYKQIMQMQV